MMIIPPETREKMKGIRVLILDVDGVMTDGSIRLGKEEEYKVFNVRDGAGTRYLQRSGIQVAILTGRESEAVSRRARELGITECLQGCRKKLPAYVALLEKLEMKEEHVAYLGDDLPDLPLFNHCGLRIAPQDAAPEVKERADLVTECPGGRGAVREAAEYLLKAQGKWEALLEGYLVQ